MAYNENKPEATDILSQSQADLKGNFTSNKQAFDINHVTFDIPNKGKHKYVTFPEQAAAPATAIDEMALYTKEVGGNSALFIRPENNGTEIDISTATTATTGTCTLPSGIILKWGTAVANGTAQAFTVDFPTNCLNVSITTHLSIKNRDTIAVRSFTAANFTAQSTTAGNAWGNTAIYYFAVGY